MTQNEIHEARMRDYFIQSAKNIIKGEGTKAISVRNIAEGAGYSYATLYTYFQDIKDLMFECVRDFEQEIEASVNSALKDSTPGFQRLDVKLRAYVRFFIQYPGIFDLFFLQSDMNSGRSGQDLVYGLLGKICADDLEVIHENNGVSLPAIQKLEARITFAITGLLLFYLNRHQPQSYEAFLEQLDELLQDLLTPAE
ncbi:MAG: TetR/AcrR family transcriptional regulator [FCB group bacterium]|nr:TetR/AcrR family transcriptional regulator [FCB group bacterium]